MAQHRHIVLCPHCAGAGFTELPDGQARTRVEVCDACGGHGRLWRETEIVTRFTPFDPARDVPEAARRQIH